MDHIRKVEKFDEDQESITPQKESLEKQSTPKELLEDLKGESGNYIINEESEEEII